MKIRFITPYFPALPSHFPLWVKSCAANPQIDWLIFTSDTADYELPPNVKLERMEYEDLKALFQSKFDFPIYLERVYKLCDFKPTYGHVFEDYLKGYDFWGYCDIGDTVFGDIRKFITDEILTNYDKIMYLGHMTLYRNTSEVNLRYLIPTKNGMPVQQILNDPYDRAFDELNESSINQIYMENELPICRLDACYADIFPIRNDFRLSGYDETWKPYWNRKRGLIFEWNRGKLTGIDVHEGSPRETEYAYVHFQKRKMPVKISSVKDCARFLITPQGFIELGDEDVITGKTVNRYSVWNPFYRVYFKEKYKALKWHLRHLKESGKW